jgi:hypothetical protein
MLRCSILEIRSAFDVVKFLIEFLFISDEIDNNTAIANIELMTVACWVIPKISSTKTNVLTKIVKYRSMFSPFLMSSNMF